MERKTNSPKTTESNELIKENKDLKKKIYIMQMLAEVKDPMIDRFFDSGNGLLDEKIEVLEGILAGKVPDEIPHYYDILCIPDPNGDQEGDLITCTHWDL